MGTFSVNIGTITESTSYPLHIQDNFDNILSLLQDNEDSLIDPKDLRDAILSIHSNIPFKQTSTHSIYLNSDTNSYIGIDSVDPDDRDNKRKIFIGKRSNSGTYSYSGTHDIMTSSLLSSDVDIFLYNTKLDTISNTITRVALLSGENPNLYSIAPFIQSEIVSGATESLSIDFVTKVGKVNVTNGYNYSSGTFSINAMTWPSMEYSTGSASDSTTLFWRGSTSSGRLSWEQITLPSMNTIGTSSVSLDIFGSPVNVNGYSLELDDSRNMPISLGGINMGTSFSNVPIVEVLRRIIYPYLGPLCSISINSNYSEVGAPADPILSYVINKRTNNTLPISLINMIPGSLLPIINPEHITRTGTASGIIPNTLDSTGVTFSVIVSDGVKTATASTFIKGIYPYFYGVVSTSVTPTQLLYTLTKKSEYLGNKIISISGTGDLYFMYDADYPDLTEIIDEVGNNVIGFFTLSTSNKTSPDGYWTTKLYKVYKWNVSIPSLVNYQFRY
jgi:hypothetical protein